VRFLDEPCAANFAGGVYLFSGGIISYCTFTNNTAYKGGGGVYLSSGSTITNSIFTNNTANSGGGIYATGNSLLIIMDSILEVNSAQQGGGFYCSTSGVVTISNSNISRNLQLNVFCDPTCFGNEICLLDCDNGCSYACPLNKGGKLCQNCMNCSNNGICDRYFNISMTPNACICNTNFDPTTNCYNCEANLFGSNCSNLCQRNCNHGHCSTGINGTGTCVCDDNYDSTADCKVAMNSPSSNMSVIIISVSASTLLLGLLSYILYRRYRKIGTQTNENYAALTDEKLSEKT